MLEHLKRLKLPLEIAAVLVGLVLGVLALWTQLKPSDDLIVEVLSTETRFPVDLIEHWESVPAKVQEALLKDEDFGKLIPNQKTREAVAQRAKALMGGNVQNSPYLGYLQQEVFGNGLLAMTIRNTSDKPIRGLRLSRRFGPVGSFTMVGADGKVEGRSSTLSAMELGDLPPRANVRLFFWGTVALLSGPEDFIVSHQDGVADIWRVVAAPELMWRNNGVFFSYVHTTYFLLAVLLLVAGTVGLSRRRANRA